MRQAVLAIGLSLMLLHAGAIARADGPKQPPGDGLVLWLDPSSGSTATFDANAVFLKLADRSGQHHDASVAPGAKGPQGYVAGPSSLPMMRFDGKSALAVDAVRAAPGGASVFIVYASHEGNGESRTRGSLFASRPNPRLDADASPNFRVQIAAVKDTAAHGQTLAIENVGIGPITIGEGFTGFIGEILVYDRTFSSEGERRKVLEYLDAKWNVTFPEPGWTREGPLDPKPVRTRDDLPLSDQANAGRWKLDPKFSDEFDESRIDANRYEVFFTGGDQWLGRAPSLFRPENTFLKDGSLHIRLDKASPELMKGHDGYKYSSGYIRTRERTEYGYYEIEARPGKSEFDNAFWFADTGDPNNGLEIDVFELGPHTRDYHNKDVMTAHVWGEHGDKHNWGSLTAYTTPWDTADAFHVYGFEWNKDELRWFIDGSLVRKLKNTNWHLPQKMIFDSEPMVDWFGPIDDSDFPTEFNIKYVRVWRQAGM